MTQILFRMHFPIVHICGVFMCAWLCLNHCLAQQSLVSSTGSLYNGVTAHRGNSIEQPENTLLAFKSALEMGVGWLELDIHKTLDGKIVVIHDKNTQRVSGVDMVVANSNYAELQLLDVSTAFRSENGLTVSQLEKTTIPLLEEVLQLVKKQQYTKVSIQPKVDCVKEAIEIVRKLEMEQQVGFNDANLYYMATVKALSPEIRVFWDRPADSDIDLDVAIAKVYGFESLVIYHGDVSRYRIQQVHAAGMEIGAWTVNDYAIMEELLEWGIDRIYTDDPSTFMRLLRKRK